MDSTASVRGEVASLNRLVAAIALKAIDVIMNEGLAENVRHLTPYFEAHMQRLLENPNIGEARGKGLMGALEAVQDKDSKTPFAAELSVSERIANTCTDHGLICRPLGQSIVLCPSFIFTESHIDEMFEKLEASLKKVFGEVA